MHAERDYLIENIFPKLKEYCRNNYQLDFQVIILIKKQIFKFEKL
jgi:hypothetical protein